MKREMGHIALSLATENLCNIQLATKTKNKDNNENFVTFRLSSNKEENGNDLRQRFSFMFLKNRVFEIGHESSLFCKYLPL